MFRLQRSLPATDLVEDAARLGGADERPGTVIMLGEVAVDGDLKVGDALNTPRQMRLRVISAKNRSIRLSHDDEVGVKCR